MPKIKRFSRIAKQFQDAPISTGIEDQEYAIMISQEEHWVCFTYAGSKANEVELFISLPPELRFSHENEIGAVIKASLNIAARIDNTELPDVENCTLPTDTSTDRGHSIDVSERMRITNLDAVKFKTTKGEVGMDWLIEGVSTLSNYVLPDGLYSAVVYMQDENFDPITVDFDGMRQRAVSDLLFPYHGMQRADITVNNTIHMCKYDPSLVNNALLLDSGEFPLFFVPDELK